MLWSIPGFSFLRAPGRFTYLVVFACACLAAFGLQALTQRRLRLVVAVGRRRAGRRAARGAAGAVAHLAQLAAGRPGRGRGRSSKSTYLATRAQYPIDPQLVVNGLLSSLDFANPKTAWSLALLALTSLGFVAWLALGMRRTAVGQGLFVGLLAVDLLVFASDFHPRAPLASLAPALPLA